MNIRRGRSGQSALEMALLMLGVIVAIVALTRYFQQAISARVKSGAEALSPLPANPERLEIASIRCQKMRETQTALGGAGRMQTQLAEAAQQATADPAPVAAFSACPPMPALPPQGP